VFLKICFFKFSNIVMEAIVFTLMRNVLAGAALVALSGVVVKPASAAPIIMLDFEGVGNNCRVEDFYNGGTDSCGNSGANFGIAFGEYSLGLVDADAGGQGNFANEPTPDTVLYFLYGPSAILNYEPGFTDGFSFYYSAAESATIRVWSGLNATGELLGEIFLPVNYTANRCQGDPTGDYCNWDIGFLAFADTAKSIDFGGTANYVGFDNITFGSTNPNQPPTPPTNPNDPALPEPGVVVLLGIGLVGLSATTRRRRGC
jgi:hypothetical protein